MKITREEAFQILEIEVSTLGGFLLLLAWPHGATDPCLSPCCCCCSVHSLQTTEDEVVIKQAFKRLALKW